MPWGMTIKDGPTCKDEHQLNWPVCWDGTAVYTCKICGAEVWEQTAS